MGERGDWAAMRERRMAEPGAAEAYDAARLAFELGAAVVHTDWGEGVVQRYERDHVVVLFDSVGYKTLGVDLVAERGLLRPAGGDG